MAYIPFSTCYQERLVEIGSAAHPHEVMHELKRGERHTDREGRRRSHKQKHRCVLHCVYCTVLYGTVLHCY
jgi:hypothetical protein